MVQENIERLLLQGLHAARYFILCVFLEMFGNTDVKDLFCVEKYENSNSQLISLLCEALNTTDEVCQTQEFMFELVSMD